MRDHESAAAWNRLWNCLGISPFLGLNSCFLGAAQLRGGVPGRIIGRGSGYPSSDAICDGAVVGAIDDDAGDAAGGVAGGVVIDKLRAGADNLCA